MDARRSPQFREMVQAAKEAGWTVEMTAGNHWRWVPKDPSYTIVVVAGTPRYEHRFIANLRSALRRRGLKV